jgi:hypothetical protein
VPVCHEVEMRSLVRPSPGRDLALIIFASALVGSVFWVSRAHGDARLVPTGTKSPIVTTTTTQSSPSVSGAAGHAVEPAPTVPVLPPIYVTSGSGRFDPLGPEQEASLSLPSGNYVVFARVDATQTQGSASESGTCSLDAGYGGSTAAASPVDTVAGYDSAAAWALVGVVHFTKPGLATVVCTMPTGTAGTLHTVLTAIPGGQIIRQ